MTAGPRRPTGCDSCSMSLRLFRGPSPKSEDEWWCPPGKARCGCRAPPRRGQAGRAHFLVRPIGYESSRPRRTFDETSWTHSTGRRQRLRELEDACRARRLGFHRPRRGSLELAIVNPVTFSSGPRAVTCQPRSSTSSACSKAPCPAAQLYFGVVDVRDVAYLHLRAMSDLGARAERFLAAAGDFISIKATALALKARLGAGGVTCRRANGPDWPARLAAVFDKGGAATHGGTRRLRECHERGRRGCICAGRRAQRKMRSAAGPAAEGAKLGLLKTG